MYGLVRQQRTIGGEEKANIVLLRRFRMCRLLATPPLLVLSIAIVAIFHFQDYCPLFTHKIRSASVGSMIAVSKTGGGIFQLHQGSRPPRRRPATMMMMTSRCSATTDDQLPILRSIKPCKPQGELIADMTDEARDAVIKVLSSDYVKVDIDHHQGVRLLNLEPPVLTVDNFFSPEDCDNLIEAAEETGRLKISPVGGNYFGDGGSADVSQQRRTSSSLIIDETLMTLHPKLRDITDMIHEKASALLPDAEWSSPGKLPPPGKFVFEQLQVARYEKGQHFLLHEDGFPVEMARMNRFQRRATILVYLNEVASAGRTSFERLGIASRPEKGKALVFFPSTSDGLSDPRSIHQAEDADDTKWVMQIWVSWGLTSAFKDAIGKLPTSSAEEAPKTEEKAGGGDTQPVNWRPRSTAYQVEQRRRAHLNNDVDDNSLIRGGRRRKKDGGGGDTRRKKSGPAGSKKKGFGG